MIVVSPLYGVENLAAQYDVYGVIGLLAGHNEHPEIDGLGPDRHLKLTMHDINAPMDGMTMPGEDQVAELIDYVRDWNRARPLLVHCWAGISRSTATAFIAQCVLRQEVAEDDLATELRSLSPSATPNRVLVAHADKLLGRGGRMSDAIAAIGRGEDAFEGRVFEWPVG